MAIDFSQIGGTAAHTGKIDFSAIGGVPAVGQDEPTDETTALGAAGRGAASMIPLGNQAYSAIAGAIQKEPYLQERQELEKETAADIANHPIPRLAGQAAGIVAPALVTGGSSAPESLLGAVGQGAGIGAGFGAGNAIDTIASGGSGAKAAGDVALGAGLGAAGGAVGRGLGALLEKPAAGLENLGVTKAAEAMNLSPEQLGNMRAEDFANFQQFVKQNELLGKTPQEMLDKAAALQDKFGSKIGEVGDKARELGLSTDTKPLLAALEPKYQASAGLQNPDEVRNAMFYKKGMADILAMSRRNLPENLAPVQGAPVPSDITFDELSRLKKSYGNSAFMNGTVKNPAAADVYSQLSAGQKAIVKTAQNNPNLSQEYKDALAGYAQMSPIVDGLEQRVGIARSGGGGGNVASNITQAGMMAAMGRGSFAARQATRAGFAVAPETVARAANATASGISATGAVLPVTGAQIAGSLPVSQNMGTTKPINTQGSSAPSQTNTGATTINVDHPALAPWKAVFQKNAANAKDAGEVQKSNAVTDFVLSQRDPAYAAAKQKMSENPIPKAANTEPAGMADGGVAVAPSSGIDEPIPAMGSTLQGLADQLKNPTHEAPPVPDKLPTSTTQRFHQPFNPEFADKLRAFLNEKKEKTNGGS
jgi:hypothetical protein